MRRGVVLIGWIVLLTLPAACSSTEPRDSKDRPRVGVIGHGTTPGYSWAGVGVTVPFPGKGTTPSQPASSGHGSQESEKPKTEN